MERIGASIKGMYRDILKGPDNNVIFDSGWGSNMIVDRCRILLAAFMKNEGTMGIQNLKVGTGNKDWDNEGPPEPDALVIGLEDPNPVEVANLDLVYLNDQDAPVTVPTPRLQITATLGEGEPEPPEPHLTTYPLREFGLFGKFGDEEYMIDCIRHPVIHKDVSSTLVRVVRLYF
ncbi:MAG: hypothetical protein GTO45_41040 [Candidatus Aminicenantes bacterium]|nr:hypothetical protein [Candidatus Aminicenantes bacterium]NIM84991.1 hypothetical protein [Candidatus Aminicenantes bacterium]NIN24505.1 hypothetical protein [Candidatus Aminicenantes bacterium]NIN48269.1 hypothetical protein [Candidatus Aminicenantes bacterium]NIN91172.1 hypothetical protein [Candidatus Aminicenantes bacterium]